MKKTVGGIADRSYFCLEDRGVVRESEGVHFYWVSSSVNGNSTACSAGHFASVRVGVILCRGAVFGGAYKTVLVDMVVFSYGCLWASVSVRWVQPYVAYDVVPGFEVAGRVGFLLVGSGP